MKHKKSLLIFIISFLFFGVLSRFVFHIIVQRQITLDQEEVRIIAGASRDRFKLFIDLPKAVGLIAADYFSKINLNSKIYAPFGDELRREHKEILGLNVVDLNGKIIRVYPEQENIEALGKHTQNIQAVQKSWNNKETFWLSPPFELLQGMKGFAFYMPIVMDQKLRGWVVPVISSPEILKKFRAGEFLKTYHIIVIDAVTGTEYFSTAAVPKHGGKIYQQEVTIYGRKLLIKSWRHDLWKAGPLPWGWNVLIAVLGAHFTVFIIRLYRQRKLARFQLEEISILLRLTSKEALSTLVDAHDQVNKRTSDDQEKINYVSNLLEQIDLLQTLTLDESKHQFEELNFGKILEEQLGLMKEISEKKKIKVLSDFDSFRKFNLRANRWLIQNSVVTAILAHLFIYAREDSLIEILPDHIKGIKFHAFDVLDRELEGKAVIMDRRMTIAMRVLELYGGSLDLSKDLHRGLVVTITLPAPV